MKSTKKFNKTALAILSASLFTLTAHGADSQLSCLASPANLAVATGKALPKCSSETTPGFRSHLDPVSAVFVMCSGGTMDSCLNIVEAMVVVKTGAKVNVLVAQGLLKYEEFKSQLTAISEKASPGQLNVISVAPTELQFMRDPFFIESQNGVPAYHNFPTPQVVDSGEIIDQAMQACGIQKADGTYENPNPPSASWIQRNFLPSDVERADQRASKGGNILTLPNGALAIGRVPRAEKPHPEFINYLAHRAKLLEVEIPRLRIGHIDEVFNIIPNPQAKAKAGQCDFALLRASPRRMGAFLKTQKQLPSEVAQETSSNRYADDAARAQEIIDQSTKVILAELSSSGKGCVPAVVDIPVAWSQGFAVLPNPVNGLHVNGAYFLSAQKFPAIETEIKKILKPYFKKGIHFVDTSRYDTSLGNIHCATQNISVNCQ